MGGRVRRHGGLAATGGTGERDEYLDSLLRLQAEFDNYRKRVDRQQREILENAAASLVKKLLPVLDTADLALAHGGGEDVKQVAGALFDILSKEGLERIDPRANLSTLRTTTRWPTSRPRGRARPKCPKSAKYCGPATSGRAKSCGPPW